MSINANSNNLHAKNLELQKKEEKPQNVETTGVVASNEASQAQLFVNTTNSSPASSASSSSSSSSGSFSAIG